jgi:hypothetical protein
MQIWIRVLTRLHWFAILIALGILVLIATGAAVTSLHDQPGRHAAIADVHRDIAVAMALPGAIFFIWFALAGRWRILASAAILAAGSAEAWLGTERELASSPATIGTTHAWLGAMLFGSIAAIVWSTSAAFQRAPELVQDYGWPSLRFLSKASIVLIAAQVEAGAAYRHNIWSVIPHLLGAPVVTLVVMMTGAFVLQQFPKHRVLRAIAVAVLIITAIQVALGLITLLVGMTQSVVTAESLAFRIAHVTTGNLTLAAMVVLAIEIQRCVMPKPEDASEKP